MNESGAWFDIPGVQKGRRTLEEQMTGLAHLGALVRGKTVCDLGCAEGLIALECAKAGAARVYGCDYNPALITTARALAERQPEALRPRFELVDLRELMKAELPSPAYDVVLALAVIHKLQQPRELVEFCADVAREWVIYRLPERNDGSSVRAKHNCIATVNVLQVMSGKGFNLDRVERGPRRESVQYWRRRNS